MRTSRTVRTSYRALLAVTAAAASAGLLAGCSTPSDGPTTTRTVTAPAPSAAATPSASPSATASPTTASSSASAPTAGAAKADPDAPAGQCADSALKVSVQYDPEAAGAGQRGAFVVFRNTGSGACRLEGAPGLSLVGGGDGAQIGPPAQRSTSGEKLVTLAPGKAALAQVTYTYVDENGGNYSDGEGHDPACRAEAADGYRVYPPHSYRAFFSADKTYACSTDVHWITVGPVRPATDFRYFTPKA